MKVDNLRLYAPYGLAAGLLALRGLSQTAQGPEDAAAPPNAGGVVNQTPWLIQVSHTGRLRQVTDELSTFKRGAHYLQAKHRLFVKDLDKEALSENEFQRDFLNQKIASCELNQHAVLALAVYSQVPTRLEMRFLATSESLEPGLLEGVGPSNIHPNGAAWLNDQEGLIKQYQNINLPSLCNWLLG